MFYEESLIDGVWMKRTTPNGEWTPLSYQKMSEKVEEVQNGLAAIVDMITDHNDCEYHCKEDHYQAMSTLIKRIDFMLSKNV